MEIMTTMITPYLKDYKIDIDTALKYVDWYFEGGIDGIFSVCQSSEIFFLSLEERVELNRAVYRRAKELEKTKGRPFTVVSSGHVSYSLADQARELTAIWESGTDCIILITNRLDPDNLGDEVFISNLKRLMSMLPAEVRLGLYECPYPYKRLVSERILDFCASTGRFDYMKDTCCDADMIARRTELLKGSGFKLLNANCQTLLESVLRGAGGYCGIMCNYHPKLYSWLSKNYISEPEKARLVQALIGTLGFTESGLAYPLSAKYHMNLCGIPTEVIARNRKSTELTAYGKSCMEQMKLCTDSMQKYLGI